VDWIDEDKTVVISTDDGAVAVVPTVTPVPIEVEASPTPAPVVAVEGELPPGNIIVESKMNLNGITFYLGETKESIESKFGKPLSTTYDKDLKKTTYHYDSMSFNYYKTGELETAFIKDPNFKFSEDYYVGLPYDLPDRDLKENEKQLPGLGADYTALSVRIRDSAGTIIATIHLYGNGNKAKGIRPTIYSRIALTAYLYDHNVVGYL
jgi:hypothetical protein